MSLASDYAAAVQADALNAATRLNTLIASKPPDFIARGIVASVTSDGLMAVRGEGVIDLISVRAFGVWIRGTFG